MLVLPVKLWQVTRRPLSTHSQDIRYCKLMQGGGTKSLCSFILLHIIIYWGLIMLDEKYVYSVYACTVYSTCNLIRLWINSWLCTYKNFYTLYRVRVLPWTGQQRLLVAWQLVIAIATSMFGSQQTMAAGTWTNGPTLPTQNRWKTSSGALLNPV